MNLNPPLERFSYTRWRAQVDSVLSDIEWLGENWDEKSYDAGPKEAVRLLRLLADLCQERRDNAPDRY